MFPILTMADLRFQDIENYVDVTGFPLCYYFFHSPTPVTPTYTPYDKIIIEHLNALPEYKLEKLKNAVRGCMNNPLLSMTDTSPNKRLSFLLNRGVYGEARTPVIPEYKKFSGDIQQYIYKFSYRYARNFPVDIFEDVATYAGVSLYWIFNFKRHPLFCDTAIADEVFALYTLLEQNQWPLFMRMLLHTATGYHTEYDDLFRMYAYFLNAGKDINTPETCNAIRHTSHLSPIKYGLSEKEPAAWLEFIRDILQTTLGLDIRKYDDLIGGAYLERFDCLAIPNRRTKTHPEKRPS